VKETFENPNCLQIIFCSPWSSDTVSPLLLSSARRSSYKSPIPHQAQPCRIRWGCKTRTNANLGH